MKATKKRVAAEKAAIELSIKRPQSLSNETLYSELESRGHIWNAKAGMWERGSKSMFKDADGQASGVIRLRVMGHPSDVDKAVSAARKMPGYQMIESSEHYPNRRGEGVRVYCTLVEVK